MFAYGHKYLGGSGDMFLLYPQSANFEHAIESTFCFNSGSEQAALRLWIVPVDLTVKTDNANRIKWPINDPLSSAYLIS